MGTRHLQAPRWRSLSLLTKDKRFYELISAIAALVVRSPSCRVRSLKPTFRTSKCSIKRLPFFLSLAIAEGLIGDRFSDKFLDKLGEWRSPFGKNLSIY